MIFLTDAQARLTRYFSNGGWDIYDGVIIQHDSTFTVSDILVSVALNSQLDTRKKISQVWQHRASLENALTQVPPHITLTDEYDTIPWDALSHLFTAFCSIKYAKAAVATKVLHKKRPGLIPIYDRFIGEFFRPTIEPSIWRQGGATFLIAYMQSFREVLLTYQRELEELCIYSARFGWLVTPVRMLEVLIWIAYEPLGYYKIPNE